jgi:hypothetical protein
MPRPCSRAVKGALVASAILLAAGASVAHADLLGGDVAVLTSIFHTSLQQLDQLRSMTDSLAKSYGELQRVVRTAESPRTAFQDFQRLDGNRTLTSGVRALDGAFRGVAFVAGEVESTTRLVNSASGQLTAELKSCIDSLVRSPGSKTPECDRLKLDATTQRIETSLQTTYGSVPTGRVDLTQARKGNVTTEQGRLLDQAKFALVSADATDMLTRCKDATESVICQRLVAEAGIKSYEQQAEVNRKLDEVLHEQAIGNEIRITEARRAFIEEQARRSALVSGLAPGTTTGP